MQRLTLLVLILFLPAISLSQVEIDERGLPVHFQKTQWHRKNLSTPEGIASGWQTQTRTQDAHYLAFYFEPTKQVVEINFSLKTPPKGQRGLSFGLSYGAPTHWANEAFRLAFGGNGFLMRRDVGIWFTWRSNFSWLTVAPFHFEDWLKVRILADPTIGAFQIWLNGHQVYPTNLPFSSPTLQLNCFFLFNGDGTGTNLEVTDPKIIFGALPNAPKSLIVLPVNHDRLQLIWQPSETSKIRAYRIYRQKRLMAEVKANETSWTDTTVKSGEAYGYFVTAVADLKKVEHEPTNATLESLPSWQDAAMPLPKNSPLVPRPRPVPTTMSLSSVRPLQEFLLLFLLLVSVTK